VIELAHGLSGRARHAISDLEMRVLAADGGRLKLEWRALESRNGQEVNDVLWWDGERVLGFLGLYAYGGHAVEIAGMVDPDARRGGIATRLLEEALPICRARRFDRALLIIPRQSEAGQALAVDREAVLDHSEHALLLTGPPAEGDADPSIELRTATSADVPELSRLLSAGFGGSWPDPLGQASDASRTLLVEREGVPVGTIRVTRDRDDRGGIYGFAVDPAWQGRGIGRDVLRRACLGLRAEGVQRIGLEVEVENDHALGLYLSLGFTQATTEDYYALPLR
jgi:ribosomal protein S18 acetylase RimI-like enzyme